MRSAYVTTAGNVTVDHREIGGSVLSIPRRARHIVIMSHGFSSNKDSPFYQQMEYLLNSARIGTCRYNYYGHGPEYGIKGSLGVSPDVTLSAALKSLQNEIALVRRQGDYEIALLGSSFGGLLSLLAAAHDPSIRLLALKSPVTEPISFWRDRITEEQLSSWHHGWSLQFEMGQEKYLLESSFWEDLQPYDTLAEARNIKCPTLIVHGTKDSCVPQAQSDRLAEILGGKVVGIQGADHGYTNPQHYAMMQRRVLKFLTRHCQ